MNIAIFGSCVSRDTCEYLSDANVVVYVARQSVTSLASHHGEADVDLSALESAFQRRMVLSDLAGSGTERIVKNAEPIELVLLDLADERRGYWLFQDGTTMTNSLEIEACGAAAAAKMQGARLVDFGTDEHFTAWKHGFKVLIEELQRAHLLDRSIFLDIEWAQAIDDAPHPKDNYASQAGRKWRRIQRGARAAYRQLSAGRGIKRAWNVLRKVEPTDAEEFSDRAQSANHAYRRYREIARANVPETITRSSEHLRINSLHRWGPEPFHYRKSDYKSIVQDIRHRIEKFNSRAENE